MNLYLRLFAVLIRALLKKRSNLFEPSVTRWRVMPGDIDLFGHMNNGRYLGMMDLARIDFLVRRGFLPTVLKQRWIVPIGCAYVDFQGSLQPFAKYEIRTTVAYWDSRWFYFRQEFATTRNPDRVVAIGWAKAIFRDGKGTVDADTVIATLVGHPVARPELTVELREKFGIGRPRVSSSGQLVSEAPKANRDRTAVTVRPRVLDRPAELSPPKVPTNVSAAREPLAIVGIGCRLPGGAFDATSFWQLLMSEVDAIVDIPETRWDPRRYHDPTGKSPGRTYVQRAGLLQHDILAFDPGFFEMNPREATSLDPQQRLLLQTSWEAFEDAGIPPLSLAKSRTGVFTGGFMMDNLIIHANPDNRERISTNSAAASTLTMLSNRLSYFYDLRGPSISIDTACSSSLVAIHYACESIWSGESEMAIAGGVNAILLPETQITMSKGRFLSPRGRCHAFSDRADGYARAEGAGVIVLKPLSAALRDGNPIYATIHGSAVNQDGRTPGITVPNGDAQVAVMRDAYARAGIDPARVSYVEAHGTGTPVGDPIEARAIGAVVGQGREADPCLLGSVKTNLGHLEAAAGVTAVIKGALCVKHGIVPKHLHAEQVNPNIPLEDLGLMLATQPMVLGAPAGTRIAGVNSFGYGGTNAHVVLSDEGVARRAAEIDNEPTITAGNLVLPLSARSPEALTELARQYDTLLASEAVDVARIVRSAAVHRSHQRHRIALHAASAAELRLALAHHLELGPAAGVERVDEAPESSKILFVYTGMGPQWWAMGQELYESEPVYRQAVDACDDAFHRIASYSIREEMLRDEASSRITRTEFAQTANVVLQIALTRLWASRGVVPDAVIGHSIGEVGAAFAAGALTVEDALTVAYHRSRLQQLLAGKGAMLAVGLSPEEAEQCVSRFGPTIAVAAVNSETQVTLAGNTETLQNVANELERTGRFQRFLKVEVPYHSPVMDAVKDELLAALDQLAPKPPVLPIYSTVHGRELDVAGGERHDRAYWWANARQSVLFASALAAAIDDGYQIFLEVGPHPVLAPSIRDVLRSKRVFGESVASLVRKQPEVVSTRAALARLYAAGASIDWKACFGSGVYTPIPKYPWQNRSLWGETERSLQRRTGSTPHPLLSTVGAGAGAPHIAELNLAASAWLMDHVVGGSPIFPGAGHVELALAARRVSGVEGLAAIEQLEFVAPVPLDPSVNTRLLVELSSDSPVFRIHMQTGEERPVLCARGKLCSLVRTEERIDVEAELARLPSRITADDLYSLLDRRGLSYGPSFRAVEQIALGDGHVVAHCSLPSTVDEAGYALHPVLLDAALHSLIAASLADDDGQILPVSIDRIQLLGKPGRHIVALGRLRRSDGDTIRGDITLVDAAGVVVARIDGLTCRVLERPASQLAQEIAGLLYEREWKPIELEDQADLPDAWVVVGRLDGLASEATIEGVRVVSTACAPDDAAGIVATVAAAAEACGKSGEAARVYVVDARALASASRGMSSVQIGQQLPLLRRAANAADALLATVKAMAPGRVERCFVLTRNAERTTETDPPPDLEVAPLTGLARTAMTERPDLRLTLVDLDEEMPAPADLFATLARLGTEQEVARRAENHLALRLSASSAIPAEASPLMPITEAYGVVVGEKGRLESLGFEETARRPPGPGEIEMQVEIVPLGFKDVMKALGLVSQRIVANTEMGDGIGMEGSGRVVAVGEGVTEFEPGDRVYAVGANFLASHVTLDAVRFVKLPADMSFVDGSNLLVFLTVYHSLVDIARLERGESVLIHGATGGVGLAALQIARWLGATVYATAGTDEKRALLREMGLEHVSSSRDVSFYDDVKRWTGGRGVDVVLNYSPGEIMTKSIDCLAPFGRFIELGKMSFDQDAALNMRPFIENLTFAAVDFDRILKNKPAIIRRTQERVTALFAEGHLQPLPSTVFPASQVADAFRHMARGKHIGKVCVAVADPALQVLPRKRPRFHAEATYLVTGGLGGFGLRVARWMAENGAKHLALVSRSGARSDEAKAALAALASAGVQARAFAADVGSYEALANVVGEIRATMPPLRGVVHGAAVLDDKPLEQLDLRSLDAVLSPKATGAWNLHELTLGAELDHFVLFSSISSLIGNAHQGNYVAANAFLDQLAVHRRAMGLCATTINWGVLGESGMVARNAGLGRHLAQMGLVALSDRVALAALGTVLDENRTHVAVVGAEWDAIAAAVPQWAGAARLRGLADGSKKGAASARAKLASLVSDLDDEAALSLIESELVRICAKVTRMSEAELVPTRPLREFGMDSLMGLEFVAETDAVFGVKVPTMTVVSGPPLREIANLLLGIARGAGDDVPTSARVMSGEETPRSDLAAVAE